MGQQMYVATNHGVAIAEQSDGAWRCTTRHLTDRNVQSIAAQNGVILAGSTDGIFRSEDGGQSWAEAGDGTATPYARFLAFHPTISGLVFAGAEPAGIFVSHDAGTTWRECPEVARLRNEHGWFLPYSPGAGCVRSFAFHGSQIYAAVEIGGVLRSSDGGETWQLVEGSTGEPHFRTVPRTFIHPDVHYVAVRSDMPDVVYAATMRGLYRTTDAGRTWLHLYADCYIRALWIDPNDNEHLIIGPADDVSINGQIEESHDNGYSFSLAATGLAVPWRRACIERFAQVGDELMGVLSDGNGQLLAAPLATMKWQRILANVDGINAVATMATVASPTAA